MNNNLNIFIINKIQGEILIISIYIDDFFFILYNSKILAWFKNFITWKYIIKDLKKVKIIIGKQVTKDFDTKMLKIVLLAFIHNFFKSKNIIDCNFINILIKTRYFINIQKLKDYKKNKIKSYL